MTKVKNFYIGVKIIEAWPEEKDGKPGYAVRYSDDYISWSPKDIFESAYYQIGDDPSKVNSDMVDDFFYDVESKKLEDDKTVLTRAELITGFTQYETSSCVDPMNFSLDIGERICKKRIRDEVWKLLGFVLQWGRFGLKAMEDDED